LGNAGAWDGITRLTKSGTILLPDLKPEIAKSYEYGLDLNLYANKLRFSATYYQVENRNQIIPTKLPGSSGFTEKHQRRSCLSAKVLNSHWEERLSIKTDGDGISMRTGQETGLPLNRCQKDLSFYTLWTDAKGGAWTYVGEKIGDLYDSEIVTVKDKIALLRLSDSGRKRIMAEHFSFQHQKQDR
jgi:hypothetical protein